MTWPSNWTRPEIGPVEDVPPHDAHEAAQSQRDQAHFERTRNVPPSKRVK